MPRLAGMLKRDTQVPTVDPLTAARALYEVIDFASGHPTLRLTCDLALVPQAAMMCAVPSFTFPKMDRGFQVQRASPCSMWS